MSLNTHKKKDRPDDLVYSVKNPAQAERFEIFKDRSSGLLSHKDFNRDVIPLATTVDITTLQNSIENIQAQLDGIPTEIYYSDVFIVDPLYGFIDPLQGRFDKPYISIGQALSAANAINPSVNNRAMVWIRKGEYFNQFLNAYNNVDVYCEPGVVFVDGFRLTDSTAAMAVNFNWYGFAKWNIQSTVPSFRWQYASTVLIQGDSFVNTGAISICFNVTVGSSNITYDFNSMESLLTLGNGFAFSWRNNCNGTINVRKSIKSPHVHHDIRASHSGKIQINCPRNILTAVNVYGGNFKQILYATSTIATSEVELNGDSFNEMPTYLGGVSAMIRWQVLGKCVHNGNINGGQVPAVWNASSGRVEVYGDIKSNINTIVTQFGSMTIARDGAINNYSGGGNSIYMFGGTLFLQNCSLYFSLVNGTMFGLDAAGVTNLRVINCVSKSEGLLGEFVTSTALKSCQFTNTVANKPLNTNVTNQLASGLIVAPLLEVPTF